MKSKKIIILWEIIFSFGILFLYFSCASNTDIVDIQNPVPEEMLVPDVPVVKEDIPKWEKIYSLDEITGLWISDSGEEYEWPFVLNRKTYFRYAGKEIDVTEGFVNYAKSHNMDFEYLWAHRFAYLSHIYLMPLQDGRQVPSPFSDSNGNQQGFKLRADYNRPYNDKIRFRIYLHTEILVPERIARNNTSFFMILGNDTVKGNGYFNAGTVGFRSYGMEFKKSVNYWTKL